MQQPRTLPHTMHGRWENMWPKRLAAPSSGKAMASMATESLHAGPGSMACLSEGMQLRKSGQQWLLR